MSQIVIGKAGNRNVSLDLDVLIRTRLLIQANSGKGKSWLLRRLAEQLFGKVQVIILDPEGEFASLREIILRALAELRSIGKERPLKEMVAGWAGYSPNGGGFNNPLGALRTRGFVQRFPDGTVALTDEGSAHTDAAEAPGPEEIHRRILAVCSGPEQKLLRVLIEEGGQAIPRAALAERAGYEENGGGFLNPLGALRTKGFVEYSADRTVRAADWLFLQ